MVRIQSTCNVYGRNGTVDVPPEANVGAFMVGTDPSFTWNLVFKPRLIFIRTVSSMQSSLKCAEHTLEALVRVKSERVLFTNRTHALRVVTFLGKISQKTSGFFTQLRVQPPTTQLSGIAQHQQRKINKKTPQNLRIVVEENTNEMTKWVFL